MGSFLITAETVEPASSDVEQRPADIDGHVQVRGERGGAQLSHEIGRARHGRCRPALQGRDQGRTAQVQGRGHCQRHMLLLQVKVLA